MQPVSKYSVEIDADANTSHAIMLRLVGGSKRVLDVGCATGDLARALIERGCTVSGVEIDEAAAEVARPALERLVIGDLSTLDLPAEFGPGGFDVVVFGDVLEHLVDPLPVLRSAKELLAPGGYVVVSVPNIAHADVRLALLNGDFTYRPLGLLDETHVRFFTRRSLYALLADAGFAAADVRRTVAPVFGTEIEVQCEDVPSSVVERLLEDPEAETYQFVLSAVPDDANAMTSRLRTELDETLARERSLIEELAAAQAELNERLRDQEALLKEKADRADNTVLELEGVVRQQAAELRRLRQERNEQAALRQTAEERLAAMLGSTAWRVAAPVRALGPLRAAVQGPVQTRKSLRNTANLRKVIRKMRQEGIRPALSSVQTALAAADAQAEYLRWVAEHDTLSDDDRAAIRRHVEVLPRRPLLSVVVPAYNTDEGTLRDALDSVLGQLYPDWELCVVDDASPDPRVWRTLQEYAASDKRVVIQRRSANGGIAAATNDAIGAAAGEYVVLFDHDDLLPPHALYMVALEAIACPEADLIYSDEDKLDSAGRRYGAYFKSDFNHELLLGQNMISHLGVYRTSLIKQLGGLRTGYEGSQDHDLALRVVANSSPERIRHIPHILYHWRQYSGSETFSSSNPDRAAASSRRAVADHLQQLGEDAKVVPEPNFGIWNRIIWPIPAVEPEVTVVIPTRDRTDLLRPCLEGLLGSTDYSAIRVIVVDNDSIEPTTHRYLEQTAEDPRVRVLRIPGPFNYSALNNKAVNEAKSPFILFLNNDVEVREPGWLREMVSLALRPGVGAVGAKLLFENGLVQHGGVVLGVLGVANHAHKFVHGAEPGYSGRLCLLQEFTAVTAACMLTSRAAFLSVGGFDEENLPIAYNDIDYCLRLREAGLRILWTPHAELVHHESMTRGNEEQTPEQRRRFEIETEHLKRRWGAVLRYDSAYNPNLTTTGTDFSLSDVPRRSRPWTAHLA